MKQQDPTTIRCNKSISHAIISIQAQSLENSTAIQQLSDEDDSSDGEKSNISSISSVNEFRTPERDSLVTPPSKRSTARDADNKKQQQERRKHKKGRK